MKALYTVTQYQDGSKHVYSTAPKLGESPYSPELLAVLEAAKRPVAVVVTEPVPAPSPEPTPVPPPPPAVPAPTLIQPATPEERGDGARDKSLFNVIVKGHSQNVVVEKPGKYTFDNLWTVDSFRRVVNGKPVMFEGQGLYVGGKENEVTVTNSYFGRNGWQEHRKPSGKTVYAHGIYANTGGSITVENVVFDRPCAQALKLMRNSRIKNVYIHRAAIGLSAIYGSHLWENVTIYGGGYVWDGTNWTSNTAITTYCPVTLRDVHAIGAADMSPPGPGKAYDMGCIIGESWHGQYPNLAGSKLDARDCKVSGWLGKTFAGAKAHDGSGFVVEAKKASPEVDAQIERLLSLIRDGKERVTAAKVQELQALARS